MKKIYSLGTMLTLGLMMVSVMAFAQAELVAHYTFDETSGTSAADASGNGHTGIIKGAANWVTGEIGGALELSGENGVTLPAQNMNMYSDEGSVAFWVLKGADVDGINTIFWGGNPGTDTDPLSMGGGFGPEDELHVMIEAAGGTIWKGGEIGFWAYGEPKVHVHSEPSKGTAGNNFVDPILVNDSVWHHIAATWGDGFVKFYIDGVSLWDTATYTAKDNGFPLDSIFLGRMGNNSRRFVGALDDFRIYTGVLEADEVSDLFNKVVEPSAIGQLQADAINLSVFPNPASSKAQISFLVDAGQNVAVSLISVTGSVISNVYEGVSIAGTNLIDLNTSGITPGVYFVELQVGGASTFSKLVIQ